VSLVPVSERRLRVADPLADFHSQVDAAFVATPNNPTGPAHGARARRRHPRRHGDPRSAPHRDPASWHRTRHACGRGSAWPKMGASRKLWSSYAISRSAGPSPRPHPTLRRAQRVRSRRWRG
jgi:hypothetical protein